MDDDVYLQGQTPECMVDALRAIIDELGSWGGAISVPALQCAIRRFQKDVRDAPETVRLQTQSNRLATQLAALRVRQHNTEAEVVALQKTVRQIVDGTVPWGRCNRCHGTQDLYAMSARSPR